MLPKKNRADKKTVQKIFKEGKFINSAHLTFKFILNGQKNKKISFIVPKNASKLAVKRNFLRRLGYSVLSKTDFPAGIYGAFIFRKYEDDPKILQNEIKAIFSKVH